MSCLVITGWRNTPTHYVDGGWLETEQERTERQHAVIMRNIHDACAQTAEAYDAPGKCVLGADIAGFVRVAEVA